VSKQPVGIFSVLEDNWEHASKRLYVQDNLLPGYQIVNIHNHIEASMGSQRAVLNRKE
jgi:hypothetical protein